MELYKTNPEIKMIVAAVINGQTKFLNFKGLTDPYTSNIQYANKYGNEVDNSIIEVDFSFEDQDKGTLFFDLSELIEVIKFDSKNKNKLNKLLSENDLLKENVVIQNIKGSEVTISPISLQVLFSHMSI